MTFFVYDRKSRYELPESMMWLNDYQDSSMKVRGDLTLSHVKIVEMLIRGEEYRLPYKLFIGVMPTNRNSKIIIIGEYFLDHPSDYGSFRDIEVPNSEMINFICDSDSDSDSADSDSGLEYFNIEILELENNTYAILLKTGVIIIGITPTFQEYLEENLQIDDGDYNDSYLCVERFNFVRDITDSPFDRSSIDCNHLRFDETMTSSFEKNDGVSRICLDFTRICRCSDDDCRTKLHWKTGNHIWIDISNGEIKIVYSRNTTTYDRYISDGHFNDRPTMRTEEKDDNFHHNIRYKLFQKEDD
jgi:hypothetical protein